MSVEEFTVFYAWQSDAPSRDNRTFIESALETALKTIQKSGSIESSPRLDKDTKGVPGIPDIWREHNYPRSLNYAETGDWVGQ
jgi:hypothetical protein